MVTLAQLYTISLLHGGFDGTDGATLACFWVVTLGSGRLEIAEMHIRNYRSCNAHLLRCTLVFIVKNIC